MKQNKIRELLKYFNIYGYGNFDLTFQEIEEIFNILKNKNYKKELKTFYEKLEKQRMG